jgi:hypothetical protein
VTGERRQGFWAPSSATVQMPRSIRLASRERERLWKGLERFVNCRDDLQSFLDLGRAFSSFWPTPILNFLDSSMGVAEEIRWHPAFHLLFLCYRDALRDLWDHGERSYPFLPEFLMGVTNENEKTFERAKIPATRTHRSDLFRAWQKALTELPGAQPSVGFRIGMLWKQGEFYLDLGYDEGANDFQKAFYFLFRQSWRARVCSGCKMRFIARRSKQLFCGTQCSAGSRLISKRKWWQRSGSRRRSRLSASTSSRKPK